MKTKRNMARMVWFSEWWTPVASCHSTQCYLLRRYMLIHNTFHYFMHTHAPIQGAIETRNGGWRSRGTRHMQTHRITPMFPCAAPVLCDDECVYWLQLNIIEGKTKGKLTRECRHKNNESGPIFIAVDVAVSFRLFDLRRKNCVLRHT